MLWLGLGASIAPGRTLSPLDVLAARDCLSTYTLVKENPPEGYALFRALYANARFPSVRETEDLDNEHFVDRSESPDARHLYFVHGMLKPMKRLNDSVFSGDNAAGKEDVNAARNLFRMLFLENLEAHPELIKAVDARFTDFKTLELAFDPRKMKNPSNFQNELDWVIRTTQIHFDDLMRLYFAKNPEVLQVILREQGLSGDFRAWHLFGVAKGNPDLAVAAARQAARKFDRETGIPLKANPFSEEALTEPIREVEAGIKPRLLAGLGGTKIFENYEETGHKVLALDAIDILRKVPGESAEDTAKIRKDFAARFDGVQLTDAQIADLRSYFSHADDYQPTVRNTKRTQIRINGAKDGVLNVDYAAQNVHNMYHTMGALASAGERLAKNQMGVAAHAIEQARVGEKKATERLRELQTTFDNARKAAGIEGEYQVSGDDGSVVLKGIPEGAARERFYKELLRGKPPASDYRVVWVPAIKTSVGEIDTGAISRESVKGESFEKSLRGSLYGKVPLDELKRVGISVDLDPVNKTYKLIFFGPKAAVEAVRGKALAVMTEKSLAPEGYRLASAQPIW